MYTRSYKISFTILILFLISIGLVVRSVSFFDEYHLRYSIYEDGYYMITVARNIAMGHGMSIADGLIATNGVQPLYTFLISGTSWLVNCDKIFTLKLIVLVQLLTSIATFFVIWKIGKSLFIKRKDVAEVTLFAAALWFSNPLTIINTTNGLETGFYTLSVLLLVWLIVFRIGNFNLRSSILIGLLLGITFWIRNDTVFLIASVCLSIIFYRLYDRKKILKNIAHTFLIGLVALIVALPWLIYNMNFGSIMPVSGQAGLTASAVEINYKFLAAVLTEYFLLLYPIPHYIVVKTIAIVSCSLISIFIFFLLIKNYKKFSDKQKQIFFITSIFLLELILFYGIFFKTYHYLGRYLFPISPFICLLLSAWALKILQKIRNNTLKYSLVVLFIFYLTATNLRNYQIQHDYQKTFYYLVDWVEKNVGDTEWIGAFQSGILGYYHDKTINLDGKVNPDALKAIKDGKILEYIENKKFTYFVDVVALASFKQADIINKNYDLIVEDHQKGIAIFKRKNDK